MFTQTITTTMCKQFKNYESEFTLFLKELHAKNPGLATQQQAGFDRVRDRPPLSLDDQRRVLDSTVKQQAYVYQTDTKEAAGT